MKRKILLAAMACLIMFALSGCLKSTEDLYRLPQQTSLYQNLQAEIAAVLNAGAEYSAPVAGQNRQPIQLADLDGDNEDEAIVFLKTGEAMPLKAYIFERIEGQYKLNTIIEGNGTSFQSVEYAQLDGVGGLELLIGWQVSNQVTKAITAYSMRADGMIELLSANYSEYKTVDLNTDGLTDVMVLRFSAEDQSGVAELYSYRGGQMERAPEADMSTGVSSIKRIITGYMDANVPAVFVASLYADNFIVTDVFALKDGTFQNVAVKDETGKASTVRNYYVYATDIDNDGLIELPNPVALKQYNAEATDNYWSIEWYNLTLTGERVLKKTTYHNYTGGWYMDLPEQWENLVVYRGNPVGSVRGYVFASWDGQGQAKVMFTLYAFTGYHRNNLAAQDGRFILAQKGDVTYAAKIETANINLTMEGLKALFHFIQMDWNSGEM